jgi:GNAT superfamily N-acetyltransferase
LARTRPTIRQASTADASSIAPLLGELGYPAPADALPARLERMAVEGQHVLLAELEGQVVGLATLYLRAVIVDEAPFARLAALIVAEESRGTGVGSALVAEAERLAREAGCSKIEVTSGLRRPDAHEFYRRLGFEEKPRRFVKRLTAS